MKYQVFKFLVVGGSSALLDILLVIVFKEKAGFSPVFSVALSQVFVVAYNFSLNKFWSFGSRVFSWRQIGRFLTLLAFNYILSIALMHVFNGLLGYDYRLVRLASIALIAVYNFFIYKHWVYR